MRRLLHSAPRGTGVTALAGGGSLAVAVRAHNQKNTRSPWVDFGSEDQLSRIEYQEWRTGSPGVARKMQLPRIRSPPKVHPLGPPSVCATRAVSEHFRARRDLSRLETDFLPVCEKSVLGRGSFGVVVHATSQLDRRDYAIKVVDMQSIDSPSEISEVLCMADLPAHPNLVKYHTAWLEEGEASSWFDALVSDLESSESDESERSSLAESDSLSLKSSDTTDDSGIFFPVGMQKVLPSSQAEDSARSPPLQGRLHDWSRLVQPSPRRLMIQMEYCSSPTLQSVLRAEAEGGSSPEMHVRWRWLSGLAEALSVMHAHGWAHLDVKPANAFCSLDGA
ncbi:MAG: hypothetical protein SGPRY_013094, partial [Prymnesium sp.]